MVKITYQPEPHDNDQTVVDGLTFKAYAPTEVPDTRVDLINKLKKNPWFTHLDPDTARLSAWKLVRDAQTMAKQHHDFADKVEADAIEKAKAARAVLAQAPAPVVAEQEPAAPVADQEPAKAEDLKPAGEPQPEPHDNDQTGGAAKADPAHDPDTVH